MAESSTPSCCMLIASLTSCARIAALPVCRIGQPTSSDVLVYEEKDEAFYVGMGRSHSDKLLYIHSGAYRGGNDKNGLFPHPALLSFLSPVRPRSAPSLPFPLPSSVSCHPLLFSPPPSFPPSFPLNPLPRSSSLSSTLSMLPSFLTPPFPAVPSSHLPLFSPHPRFHSNRCLSSRPPLLFCLLPGEGPSSLLAN